MSLSIVISGVTATTFLQIEYTLLVSFSAVKYPLTLILCHCASKATSPASFSSSRPVAVPESCQPLLPLSWQSSQPAPMERKTSQPGLKDHCQTTGEVPCQTSISLWRCCCSFCSLVELREWRGSTWFTLLKGAQQNIRDINKQYYVLSRNKQVATTARTFYLVHIYWSKWGTCTFYVGV